MIRYNCPLCREAVLADVKDLGRRVTCTRCLSDHVVPNVAKAKKLSLRTEIEAAAPISAADLPKTMPIDAECGNCHRTFRVQPQKQGTFVRCPKCGEMTEVVSREPHSTKTEVAAKGRIRPHAIEELEHAASAQARQLADTEPVERERVERERVERERVERERVERERVERERVERERVERERVERERAELERAEQELLRKEKEELKTRRAMEARKRDEERKLRATEKAALKAEQERLERDRADRKIAEEKQRREDALAARRAAEERERRVVAAWERVRQRAAELRDAWSLNSRTAEHDVIPSMPQRHEWLTSRRSECDNAVETISASSVFEKAETERWAFERCNFESRLPSFPARYVSPIRNRLGIDLPRFLATPSRERVAGIRWPLGLVMANPLRFSESRSVNFAESVQPLIQRSDLRESQTGLAMKFGLEFIVPGSRSSVDLSSSDRTSPNWQMVAELFWLRLPNKVIELLSNATDFADLATLSTLEAILEFDGVDVTVPRCDVQHALALYWINVAILREFAFIGGFVRSGTGYWDLAIDHWCRLIANDEFWRGFSRAHPASDALVNEVRNDLPSFLCALVLQFAQAYGRAGDAVSAERLIVTVRRSRLPEESRDLGAAAAVQGTFH